MTTKGRSAPEIPDHEVLRLIGGGSYGEVYLARGVTGVLRAVKVLWREDFDDDRTFEREFDGILKYEPISRDHSGLVNVLHIGRSPVAGEFYYYVMELGDDIEAQQDFVVDAYTARTLRSDMKAAAGKSLSVDDCLSVGIGLAGALQGLHENGLAHRDVKPANVIFIDGEAMLADIGLVAVTGGRTFVGTEGFVPPEGPGSEQADIYSLGKVLYEMASGKDRLEFPELPDELPEGPERKRWLALNQVICDICEPRLSQRKIKTAVALKEALTGVQRDKKPRVSRGMKIAAVSLFALLLAWTGLTDSGRKAGASMGSFLGALLQEQIDDEAPDDGDDAPVLGSLFIQSQPEGASIFTLEGELIGQTPYLMKDLPIGEVYDFVLKLDGFRDQPTSGRVKAGSMEVISNDLALEAPPVIDQPWVDSSGMRYGPEGERHVSYGYVTEEMYRAYLKAIDAPFKGEVVAFSQNGEPEKVVLVSEEAAWGYTDWLTNLCLVGGQLTKFYLLDPVMEKDSSAVAISAKAKKQKWRPFRCQAYVFEPASIVLKTDPPGASVLINGDLQDEVTPLVLTELVPDQFEIEFALDGFKPETRRLRLASGDERTLGLKLTSNKGVIFGKSWENSLKMPFEPVSDDLLVGRYEVRVKDYREFTQATGRVDPQSPAFTQGDNHPVVNIGRDDAKAFCVWLTEKDRAAELLAPNHEYRLPTDLEWSRMVGRRDDPQLTPSERVNVEVALYPWGEDWPPLDETGKPLANVADSTLAGQQGVQVQQTILGYNDGFPYTAPVGSFPPSEFGLYDLAGNVNEWVEDDFDTEGEFGILRGGGWSTNQYFNLHVSWRSAAKPATVGENYGFRVVLAKLPPKALRVEDPTLENLERN